MLILCYGFVKVSAKGGYVLIYTEMHRSKSCFFCVKPSQTAQPGANITSSPRQMMGSESLRLRGIFLSHMSFFSFLCIPPDRISSPSRRFLAESSALEMRESLAWAKRSYPEGASSLPSSDTMTAKGVSGIEFIPEFKRTE